MASIFTTGNIPVFSDEQKAIRIAAWKPNSARLKSEQNEDAVVLFRSPKAQAEYDARIQAAAEAKAEKRAATLAKMAATREAKKAAKAVATKKGGK